MRKISSKYRILLLASALVLSVLATIFPAYGTDQTQPQQPTLTGTASTSNHPGTPGAQAKGPAAKIFLMESAFDFGPVSEGSEVSHIFTVKNNGDAPLKLIKAKGT